MTYPTARAIIKGIATPEGFTRTEEVVPADRGYPAYRQLTLESEDVKIWITFGPDSDRHEAWIFGSGHVEFDTSEGRRSFDRYGVEDSFYIDGPKSSTVDSPADQANEAIRHALQERIPEVRARLARSVSVPGIPFMLTPEGKEQVASMLRERGTYSFMPSGFGTGYELSTRANGWGGRATKATEEFFGVGPLWVSTFDAD